MDVTFFWPLKYIENILQNVEGSKMYKLSHGAKSEWRKPMNYLCIQVKGIAVMTKH